ncbi:MAG: hypothetical protein R3339_08260, partial [Thermodesulfobacteriota bacterium]|nr:hypothetical protein [Thermodesulfobacteriota bacterium]
MKKSRVLLCLALLGFSLLTGLEQDVDANQLTPLSLLDINSLPTVATDSNDNFTITWGYFGLAHKPGILAKQYDANGDPIDIAEFWVNSSAGTFSLLDYDPAVASDSANNAVIAWCSYGLAASASNLQVAYAKIPDPAPAGEPAAESKKLTHIAPQQTDGEINPLRIPFTPAVAVDNSDNIAIAWSYIDAETAESGIYLVIVDASGTVGNPIKVVDNTMELPEEEGIFKVNQTAVNPVFYYAPDIAIDGEGNIVLTWTASGLMPILSTALELPLTAVYYSKYNSSGSVMKDYDKLMLNVGFNSSVASQGDKILFAWNVLDIFSLKIRIMATIYTPETQTAEGPIQLGTRLGYTPSSYVDAGNYLVNTGIDVAADAHGNFFVAWGGTNLLSKHIYLKEIYADGG